MAKQPQKRTAAAKHDSAESKKQLQQAAVEVFSKHGYKGATTREIAKKAGLNIALIARYFGSKEGLFEAIISEHVDKIMGELDYPPRESLEEELKSHLHSQLAMAEKDIQFLRIAVTHALVDHSFCKRISERVPLTGHPMLLQRLTALQSQGKISPTTNVQTIAEGTGAYFAGHLFANLMLFGISHAEITNEIDRFVERFASSGR